MEKQQFPKITTPFINLQSDYGFKRAFGTKRYRKNVIKLIEAALGDDINVTKIVPYMADTQDREPEIVKYHDKEVLPADVDGKRIVYDVYFTIKTRKESSSFKPRHILKEDREKEVEHHFILEMQNVYTPPFEDRMAYYMAKMVAEQGKVGWNYDLDPVILIGITDFDFPHLTKQLVQEFEFRERTSGESLTKKLRMLFYSLKQVSDDWDQCESELQRQLHLIKNMDKMDKNSKAYKEGGYEDLFESAESAHVLGEDAVLYSRSLAHLREVQAGLDFRYEIGREEGRQEDRLSEREAMARKMKAAGIGIEFIAHITEMSPDKIKEL